MAFSGRHGSLSNINQVEPTAMQVPEVKAKLVTQGLDPVAVCGANVGALLRKQGPRRPTAGEAGHSTLNSE